MRIVGFTLAAGFISVAFLAAALAQDVATPIASKKVEQVSPVWSTTLTRE